MKNSNIVDRVVDRIKAQPLGDLITEEDLYDIVKEAIPKAFFEPKTVTSGYNTKIEEPVIVSVLREVLKEKVVDYIKNIWAVENSDKIAEYWKAVMDEGLLEYVNKIQSEQATAHIRNMFQQYVSNINMERGRQGLSPIYP